MDVNNIGLLAVLTAVLFAPFLVKKVEENLEIFFFIAGTAAVTITAGWTKTLVEEALVEPVKITLAVFAAGFIFKALQKQIAGHIQALVKAAGIKLFVFFLITLLGFISGAISAIIASLVLVEIVRCMDLDRPALVRLVVLACFSIGFGAALTPIGEPLSTIVVAKLRGQPYNADFFFLMRLVGGHISSVILLTGILGALITPSTYSYAKNLCDVEKETVKDIVIRSGKVYLFVMALIFLGAGFKPVIDTFVVNISYKGLYWINLFSSVLDNAALAAAEIGPGLQAVQIKAAILGLLISGGMLIPGNIPNIISSGKLKIKSTEWAAFGLPVGMALMVACYFFLK